MHWLRVKALGHGGGVGGGDGYDGGGGVGRATFNLRPELGNIFLCIYVVYRIFRNCYFRWLSAFLTQIGRSIFLTDLMTTHKKNGGHILYILWRTGRLY